jgi:LacI family transcriptional regulator
MRRRNVALLIETSNSYARGVLEGIAQYNRRHQGWSVFLPEQERGGKPPRWLEHWKGDGIIARIETDRIAAALRRSELPVVDVSAARFLTDIPWVETNDVEIARIGVDHLSDRGFRHLAYCGDAGFNWSNWRKEAFQEIVRDKALRPHVYDSLSRLDPKYSWDREKRGLARWLAKLPRPVGILACYDIQAQKILEVCRELDLAVPEQVAVLGVDNDPLLCELADPPLSSIKCNTLRTGFEAAALLDRMMNGEPIEPKPVLVEPQGIVVRQSTDILAIDDPDVAAALRFIRENAFRGINVADVLREIPLSRRVLEARFGKAIGRTPHEEITRLKVERIKELLATTEDSLTEIARHTGFEHDEYLSVFFKKATGMPPGRYRQRVQGKQNKSRAT